ncbi:hypothetical protein PHYBLDRAFT_145952 [Phycomyces blakesleeanus NRRL 1555(-)]|uniref:Uncharacterized protein n=1 Tax=Phycomyces blakesleeanus (strain ATCC 8743b / DSM 1359 / FGSC 10004 / NBRC 33097 / NRRL 1555) TaxID=763407 RepID=A0A167MQM8_PHYB8|nr:hypothetical protein PHYBLDRAFT_145952 [Phycomyces blakesleeanus NRRL 1555(-)]OAD73559.1 hypothetical protein PHYBLDRAFT_145952 [Phycomyces blakesleeanus NRRL 1555(-)]|eukprot:XP_018291599.1 hypothetical protein PHYBLDRAFT_145952 [Phycomyces blakesleeanus NRRL 1555(-)]
MFQILNKSISIINKNHPKNEHVPDDLLPVPYVPKYPLNPSPPSPTPSPINPNNMCPPEAVA